MNIAIVGSGLHSHAGMVQEYDGKIWATSSAWKQLKLRHDGKKCDRIYQIHSQKKYKPWMLKVKDDYEIVLHKAHPDYPNAIILPRKRLRQTYSQPGRRIYTSSITFMIAMAIEEAPDEIALFGCYMEKGSKYYCQRAGTIHLLKIAEERGIKIFLPEDCDVMSG